MGLKSFAENAEARHLEIDVMKGLAILLVVFGHLIARDIDSFLPTSYSAAKELVYGFHMPLFMFVSGITFAMWWRPAFRLTSQLRASLGRVGRLMPAFLFLSVLIFSAKLSLDPFVLVDNPPQSWWSLLDILFFPASNFSSFLWYIHVLSQFLIVFPILFFVLRGNWLAIVLVAFSIWWLPSSPIFGWVRFQQLFGFFCLGITFWRTGPAAIRLGRWGRTSGLLALVLLTSVFFVFVYFFGPFRLVLGLLSLPIFWLLSVDLKRYQVNFARCLAWVGGYSFSIYLFNTMFIGVAKALLVFLGFWGLNSMGWACLFVLFVFGVFGPVVLKTAVNSVAPAVSRWI